MTKEINSKITEILERGTKEIIEKESLIKKLKSKKKLRIKHGIDPTTKDLHLGHAVIYFKLREFQEMGHQIIFLIGDFTARFGDPTQKLAPRQLKSKEEVRKMAKDYLRQVGKILDLDKLEIRYNGEWYDKMSAEKLLNLMANFTTARMLEREMFKKRMKENLEIKLHEIVYPVLQAYDSVVLKSDLTVCGSDQIFNEIRARELQEKFGQTPQDILAMKILRGTDGKEKMSQSLGNYIKIEENPIQQYGKIMSIPDHLILEYFELLTKIPLKEIEKMEREMKEKKVNPRDLKAKLAKEIVKIFHGKEKAKMAEKEFERVFRERKYPSQIPQVKIKEKRINILDLLVKTNLASSKSEAKRLVLQRGVKIDGICQTDWRKTLSLKSGQIIQVGKKKFRKIV